jgi:hypothetical protein
MLNFILHNSDLTNILHSISVMHQNQLPEVAEGYVWTQVPNPIELYTVTMVNGVPTPTVLIDAARAALRRNVRELRDIAEWSGVGTPYGPVDTDTDSQRKLSGASTAALALGASFSKEWRMADNTLVVFDAAQMIEVGLIVVAHVDACQQRKNELDAAIGAATDLDALALIDIEAGWPS